jgi:hypothetical protein
MMSKNNKFKSVVKVVCLSAVILFAGSGYNSSKSFAAEGDTVKFVNNNNIVITDSDFQRLTNLGFSSDQILNMDSEEYSLNKGLNGDIISVSKRYEKVVEKVKQPPKNMPSSPSKGDQQEPDTEVVSTQEMTKEDFDKEVAAAKQKRNNPTTFSASATDTYSTSYKYTTTSVTKLTTSTYRVKNDVHWVLMPKNRDFDVIGVAVKSQWAGNKGTEYGKQTWELYSYDNRTTTTGSSTYSTSKDASYWNIDGDGFGVKMNLKNDDKALVSGVGYIGTEVRDLDLYMYYTVGKAVTNPARIDGYGRYAHATKTLKPSFGFSLSTSLSAGFSFSLNTVDDFDIDNHTVATIIF